MHVAIGWSHLAMVVCTSMLNQLMVRPLVPVSPERVADYQIERSVEQQTYNGRYDGRQFSEHRDACNVLL